MHAWIHGYFYATYWLFLFVNYGDKMVETPTEDGGPWSVVIYGKEQCPYCDMAKKLAQQRGYNYTYKQLGIDYDLQEMLQQAPNARTFPQIIVNGKSIGGYTEFSEL